MASINEYLDELVVQKNDLVDNLTTKGISASQDETFNTLVPKVLDITSDKPDQNKAVAPTTSEQTITPDDGYELASVTVEAVTSDIDSNIIAENIKQGVTILGVTGTYVGGEYNAESVTQEDGSQWLKLATVDSGRDESFEEVNNGD